MILFYLRRHFFARGLLCAGLTAYSLAGSGVLGAELVAPEGFTWVAEPHWTNNVLSLRLQTTSSVPTKIEFTFDTLSASQLSARHLDNKARCLVASPFEHIFEAHPEKFDDGTGTMESKFQSILNSLGMPLRMKPWFEIQPFGKTKFNLFPDQLENAEGKPNISAQKLVDQITENIRAFESKLIPWPLSSDSRLLRDQLSKNNFLEAVESSVSHEENRIDAFSLFPVKSYLANPAKFKAALQSYTESGVHPVRWYVESEETFPRDSKLAVVMLLTHNHLSEENLVKAVILNEGIESGWEIFLLINRAYQTETKYWEQNHKVDVDVGDSYSPGALSYLEERRFWVVDLRPTWSTPPKQQASTKDEWVPFIQRYHYYGAFVSSLRMKEDLEIPSILVPRLSVALGLSYKLKTKALSRAQMKVMSDTYSIGARHALLVLQGLSK